jgi:hypothetical protein
MGELLLTRLVDYRVLQLFTPQLSTTLPAKTPQLEKESTPWDTLSGIGFLTDPDASPERSAGYAGGYRHDGCGGKAIHSKDFRHGCPKNLGIVSAGGDRVDSCQLGAGPSALAQPMLAY